MKKKNSIGGLSLILLAVTVISCKIFGGGETVENSNFAINANSSNSSANTKAAANMPTPYPAANCPATVFGVFELTGDKYEIYEGCTLKFRGKLLKLDDKNASLVDDSERMDLVRDEYEVRSRALSCSGDFSDSTNYQIGQKLEELKRAKQFGRLPSVTYQATVKTVGEYTSLTDCSMEDFSK